MIEELALTNFRGFGSLELKGLKPVNLVVGHNNTGKTSLLEGLLIISEPSRLSQLPNMFRPAQGSPDIRYFPWLIKNGSVPDHTAFGFKTDAGSFIIRFLKGNARMIVPGGGVIGPLGAAGGMGLYYASSDSPVPAPTRCRTISVQHRDPGQLVSLIGKAYRKKDGEETFQRILKKVDSRINKIRIDPGEDGNQVIVDIGLSELMPLSQVGQGIYRLATVLSDIIGEDPNILLIDEIENGLHHSVLEQVWTGLAETASELKVQIFATTHSGECLLAAHKAFQKRPSYDLSVIQLFRNEKGVQGRVLDQKHIEAGIEADIELR